MKLRKRRSVPSRRFVIIAIGLCGVAWAGCERDWDILTISGPEGDARPDEGGKSVAAEPTDAAEDPLVDVAVGDDVNGKTDVSADTAIPEAGNDVIDAAEKPLWTPCEPVCESGKTCYLHNTHNGPHTIGEPVCRSTGNKGPGERCIPWKHEDCVPGYTCWDNVCVKFCRNDADCEGEKADSPCHPAVYWSAMGGGWKTSSIKICSRKCDPSNPGSCESDNVGCDVSEMFNEVFICRGRENDAKGEEAACDWFGHCQPGYTCQNWKPRPGCPLENQERCGACYQWKLAGDSCPSEKQFTKYRLSATIDGKQLGWCQ